MLVEALEPTGFGGFFMPRKPSYRHTHCTAMHKGVR